METPLFIFHLLDRLTNECDALKKQIRDLKTVLKDSFEGSEDDLNELIINFQQNQENKKNELDMVRLFDVIEFNRSINEKFSSWKQRNKTSNVN